MAPVDYVDEPLERLHQHVHDLRSLPETPDDPYRATLEWAIAEDGVTDRGRHPAKQAVWRRGLIELVSEWKTNERIWSPLTSRDKVPSLIDETGYFYSLERIPEFLAQAKLDELKADGF
jgi:hypothetical protein